MPAGGRRPADANTLQPYQVQAVGLQVFALHLGIVHVVHSPVGIHPQQEAPRFGVSPGLGCRRRAPVTPSAVRRTGYGGRNGSETVNRGAATSRAQYCTGERVVEKVAATRAPD